MGPSVAAVVVAAGRGLRAGGDMPKQYRELAGEPVIRTSLRLAMNHCSRVWLAACLSTGRCGCDTRMAATAGSECAELPRLPPTAPCAGSRARYRMSPRHTRRAAP